MSKINVRSVEEIANKGDYSDFWFWWPDIEEWEHGALVEQIKGDPSRWYRYGHPAPVSPTHFFHKAELPTPTGMGMGG